ncbi:MAG TPA: helix-turn-helix domain-containing protein [Pseudonocardiaceae bacterium]|nr:helix-turn-helix domain-containing protein [Pseudonocardiaceae bacterium]
MAGEGRRGGGTREKIQQVALELFAEQGYDKTSLREIAERLEVTKAALYYHFRTKDDIVASLFDDYIAKIDQIIDWASAQGEITNEIRREIVRRYATILGEPGAGIMKFIQGNQSTMRELKIGQNLAGRFMAFSNLLIDKSTPLKTQIRSAMAMGMLHVGMFAPIAIDATPEERRVAALEAVLEMIPED